MYLNDPYKRAVKGFTISVMRDLKKMFVIVFAILACLPIISVITMVAYEVKAKTGMMTVSTGLLTVGFSTVLITLCIGIFSSLSKDERNAHFIWPINRKAYALGNSIVILLSSVIFISGVAVLTLFELIPAVILRWFYKDIFLATGITFENFLVGFWVSLCYLILTVSLVYSIGSFFYRHKIIIGTVVGALAIATSFPLFRTLYYYFFGFVLRENSVILFSIKAWAAIVLLNLLGYFAIKRLEVRV